jgi:hypothetical protein
MAYDRQWLVHMLRGLGYVEAADDAAQTMPEEFSYDRLREFGDRHNLSVTELTSQMGGSP